MDSRRTDLRSLTGIERDAHGGVTAAFDDVATLLNDRLPVFIGVVLALSFVPMMLFAILFGLSMDYEMFLLSRMKENTKPTATTTAMPSPTASLPPRASSPPQPGS